MTDSEIINAVLAEHLGEKTPTFTPGHIVLAGSTTKRTADEVLAWLRENGWLSAEGWLLSARTPEPFILPGDLPAEAWPESAELYRAADDTSLSLRLDGAGGWLIQLWKLEKSADSLIECTRHLRKGGGALTYEICHGPVPIGPAGTTHIELRPVASRFTGFEKTQP